MSAIDSRTVFVGTGELVIEDDVAIGPYGFIIHDEHVRIGSGCRIAAGVRIADSDHDQIDIHRMGVKAPVDIGRNCWLGFNVIILKGVTLGDDCIVAAGSVVTRSFPPRSLIRGVPARFVRERTVG